MEARRAIQLKRPAGSVTPAFLRAESRKIPEPDGEKTRLMKSVAIQSHSETPHSQCSRAEGRRYASLPCAGDPSNDDTRNNESHCATSAPTAQAGHFD